METDVTPRKSNQPLHHAPKNRIITQLRRRQIIEDCLDGKDPKANAIALGLSAKSVSTYVPQIISQPQVQASILRIYEESGLTGDFLAAKARALLEAKNQVFAQKDGVFTDTKEVAAHETQRKTWETVHRLRGDLKEQSAGDINIGLMQMVVQAVRAGKDGD